MVAKGHFLQGGSDEHSREYGIDARKSSQGRKSWLFAGSDRGGQRAAVKYTLIITAKLNGIDPQAWLADVLARIADHCASKLDKLLPWNWNLQQQMAQAT